MNYFPAYEKENLWLVPVWENDNAPAYANRFGEKPPKDFFETLHVKPSYDWIRYHIHDGWNVGALAGQKSAREEVPLWICDFDSKKFPNRWIQLQRVDEEHIEFFREFGTWICFTPSGGF